MRTAKKKKLENLNKKHNQYIRSLGIEIDVDSEIGRASCRERV